MNAKLMTHLYFGDPTPEFSLTLAKTLIDGGADMLEIGIPYSDPVCDGEVFQRACQRALAQGMTPFKVFNGIETMRNHGIRQPIYVTSYFGPVFKMGVKTFIRRVKSVGAQGVIIPDLLLEEQMELLSAAEQYEITVIQFATLYSSLERLRQIIFSAKDFIYCIGVPGVTGVRDQLAMQTIPLLKRVKSLTQIPAFVGFGISTPEHVRALVAAGADGVIVGSAIGRLYERYLDQPESALPEIATFTHALKTATIQKEHL